MTDSELLSMLHGMNAETFIKPGGAEFQAVYDGGATSDGEVLGFSPSITARKSDVEHLKNGDQIWRKEPLTLFEIKGGIEDSGEGLLVVRRVRYKTT